MPAQYTSVQSAAVPPTAAITEIPGRFSPIFVVDKRNVNVNQGGVNSSGVFSGFSPTTVTTLTGPGSATLPLSSTTGLTVGMQLLVGNETVTILSKTGSTVTLMNTTQANHPAGTAVSLIPYATSTLLGPVSSGGTGAPTGNYVQVGGTGSASGAALGLGNSMTVSMQYGATGAKQTEYTTAQYLSATAVGTGGVVTGATSIPVLSTAGFQQGDTVMLGTATSTGPSELVVISAPVTSTTAFTCAAIGKSHPITSPVLNVSTLFVNAPVPTGTHAAGDVFSLADTLLTSTPNGSVLSWLPRCESADGNFSIPTTPVMELGTNYNVGEYDDLPESKFTLSCYDTSYITPALLTGRYVAPNSSATLGFPDFNAAAIDIVRQYADPNGNVFASTYFGDMVIDGFTADLKPKSTAMEQYSLTGFNKMTFRGFIITKAYVVTNSDVNNGYIPTASVMGAAEAPVALPIPTGANPPSYWIQRGSYQFLKIDRWRVNQGWKRMVEGPPVSGVYVPLVPGPVYYNTATGGTNGRVYFYNGTGGTSPISDFQPNDVLYFTFCTYETGSSTFNAYGNLQAINALTADTSDPVAVPTRLTPILIQTGTSSNQLSRVQGFTMKLNLKRERAEGVGDTDGIWGPSDAPVLDLTLDVKQSDLSLLTLLQSTTGSPAGSDTGGLTSNDFLDPVNALRLEENNAFPIAVQLKDPRSASSVLKTYLAPTAVFKTTDESTKNNAAVTTKFTGNDRVGNLSIIVNRGGVGTI
jgi:hypothetical protein